MTGSFIVYDSSGHDLVRSAGLVPDLIGHRNDLDLYRLGPFLVQHGDQLRTDQHQHRGFLSHPPRLPCAAARMSSTRTTVPTAIVQRATLARRAYRSKFLRPYWSAAALRAVFQKVIAAPP